MKRALRVGAVTIWIIVFLMTPAAMAVVMGAGQALATFSEPGAMLLLGLSLISMAGFWRKKVVKN
jgi:hypothetical protein